MCVTFIALSPNGDDFLSPYKLIVVSNRDEDFARPTSRLAWKDDILAGRDEEDVSRGTWFGINRHGQAALLLSITSPPEVSSGVKRPSRGRIPIDFLSRQLPLDNYIRGELASTSARYSPFHFVGLEPTGTGYSLMSMTNVGEESGKAHEWQSKGCFGFGNSSPSTPFKKVVYGRRKFEELIDSIDLNKITESELIEALIGFGRDSSSHFPDEQIRKQRGVTDDSYKPLCSLFVRWLDPNGGLEAIGNAKGNTDLPLQTPVITMEQGSCREKVLRRLQKIEDFRSHSILLIDRSDQVTFFERSLVVESAGDGSKSGVELWNNKVERFRMEKR